MLVKPSVCCALVNLISFLYQKVQIVLLLAYEFIDCCLIIIINFSDSPTAGKGWQCLDSNDYFQLLSNAVRLGNGCEAALKCCTFGKL